MVSLGRQFLLVAVVAMVSCSLHRKLLNRIGKLIEEEESESIAQATTAKDDAVEGTIRSVLGRISADGRTQQGMVAPIKTADTATRPKKQLSPQLMSKLVRLLPIIRKNFAQDKHLHNVEGLANNLPNLMRKILPQLKAHIPTMANDQKEYSHDTLRQTFKSIENMVLADM